MNLQPSVSSDTPTFASKVGVPITFKGTAEPCADGAGYMVVIHLGDTEVWRGAPTAADPVKAVEFASNELGRLLAGLLREASRPKLRL